LTVEEGEFILEKMGRGRDEISYPPGFPLMTSCFLSMVIVLHGCISPSKNGEGFSLLTMEKTRDGGYIVAACKEGASASLRIARYDSNDTSLWHKAIPVDCHMGQILVVDDGGFIVSGKIKPMDPPWIGKLDQQGAFEWQTSLDCGDPMWPRSAALAADGGCLLLGDHEENPMDVGLVLVKLGSHGGVEWAKTIDDPQCFMGSFSLLGSNGGGFVMMAHCISAALNDFPRPTLFKLSEAGDVEWVKQYSGPDFFGVSSIAKTSSGGYAIASSAFEPSHGEGTWMAGLQENGDIVWQVFVAPGFPMSSPHSHVSVIQQTSDGGYIFAQGSNAPDYMEVHGILVLKMSAAGDMQWQYSYGNRNSDSEIFIVRQLADDSYAVAGNVETDSCKHESGMSILRLDESGNYMGACDHLTISPASCWMEAADVAALEMEAATRDELCSTAPSDLRTTDQPDPPPEFCPAYFPCVE
jgi:hypothetical protein